MANLESPKRLAVIPARGGSKRIPNKNVRDFCGSPMITHILRTASKSGLFQKIHVSTENEVIREVVAENGFSPDFTRPSELADDHTPIMPVLRYVAQEYKARGETFDEIWLLMACAPLVTAEDLEGAAQLFQQNNAQHQVLSVTEFPVPIEWAFSLDDSGILYPRQPEKLAVRSQDLVPHYFDAAAFAVYPYSQILVEDSSAEEEKLLGYILPRTRAIDIDNEHDWRLAEALLRASR